jgi:hypothetical protein
LPRARPQALERAVVGAKPCGKPYLMGGNSKSRASREAILRLYGPSKSLPWHKAEIVRPDHYILLAVVMTPALAILVFVIITDWRQPRCRKQ